MRLRLGFIILVLLTLILVGLLASHVYFEDFKLSPPRPDSIHPRPVVHLFLESRGGFMVIKGNVSLEETLPRNFRLIVRLINNSSEPSMRGDFAAGVLVVLNGARVEGYNLRGFGGVIGIDENGSVTGPVNSNMVEFFAERLDPWQSVEAELHLLREDESSCIQISYRGWIIDEDDLVLEPISGTREHYIARCPLEGYPDNPPDSRWAGKDFLKYRVYKVTVCPP